MEWFIQSDNMAIDGDTAWLVDRKENVLYKANLSKSECEFVSVLPIQSSMDKNPFSFYRINSYCHKKENSIFLMPDSGTSVLVYDLDKRKIRKIEICNPRSERLSIHDFWEDNGKLWAVSYGLSKILLIDLEKETVEEYYDIFDDSNIVPGYEAKKVEECIFNVSRNSNRICEFNIRLREKKIYEINGLTEGTYTICYDYEGFWFSGISGRIYYWEKKQKRLIEFKEYPENWKLYKEEKGKIEEINFPKEQKSPVFYKSFLLGNYICFLPLNSCLALCNKLLCVNREDGHMISIVLSEEQENIAEIYNLEYLKEDKLAGILCERNQFILEIDINMNIINRKYFKKKDQTTLMYRNMETNDMNYEVENLALKEYKNAVRAFCNKEREEKYEFGKLIFDKMKKR